jgi:hypothetical protein
MVVEGDDIKNCPEKEIVQQNHPDAVISIVFEKDRNPVKLDIVQDEGPGKSGQVYNIIEDGFGFEL